MKHQPWQFNEAERIAVRDLLDRIYKTSQYPYTVNKLVSEWKVFTQRVHKGYPGNFYEYTNDLQIRSILQQIMSVLSENGRQGITDSIQFDDDIFIEATEKVDEPLLPGIDVMYWWFFRVPKNQNEEMKDELK